LVDGPTWECSSARRPGAAASGTRCFRGRGVSGDGKEFAKVGSADAAARSQPAFAEPASLLLGGSSPHSGLLIGGQREVETRLDRLAGMAHPFCHLYLVDRRTCRADGEEQIGFGVLTGSHLPPVLCIPLDRPIPHQCHDASSGIVLSRTGLRDSCDQLHMTGRDMSAVGVTWYYKAYFRALVQASKHLGRRRWLGATAQ